MTNLKLLFDPKAFPAKVGKGSTISEYRKNQLIFSQADPGHAVSYLHTGKVKLTIVSTTGKEASIAIFGLVLHD